MVVRGTVELRSDADSPERIPFGAVEVEGGGRAAAARRPRPVPRFAACGLPLQHLLDPVDVAHVGPAARRVVAGLPLGQVVVGHAEVAAQLVDGLPQGAAVRMSARTCAASTSTSTSPRSTVSW